MAIGAQGKQIQRFIVTRVFVQVMQVRVVAPANRALMVILFEHIVGYRLRDGNALLGHENGFHPDFGLAISAKYFSVASSLAIQFTVSFIRVFRSERSFVVQMRT